MTLEELLASNLRRLRESKGWQQETLAQRACAMAGLPWTRDTVVRIEQSRRKLTPGELVALCYILGAPLLEFMRGEGKVWPGPGVSVAAADLPKLLEGKTPESLSDTSDRDADDWFSGKRRSAFDLADQRAAKAIGVEVLLISLLAHKLWGQSLTRERDRRAGRGANRMSKAHVTRELYTELSAAIAKTR